MYTDLHIEQRLVWNRMAFVANRVATFLVVTLGLAMIAIVVWAVGRQVEHYATDQVWLAGSIADAFGIKLRLLLADIRSMPLRETLMYLGTELHVAVPCGVLFMLLGLSHFLLADGFRRIQNRWTQLNFDLMVLPIDRERLRQMV